LNKNTLIVIPVFNEENVIEKVAERTIQFSEKFADILFVNDGSTDLTPQKLTSISNKFKEIYTIQKTKNEGYGASLISGLNFAIEKEYDYCITMDCDDQHQPSDIPRFMSFDASIDLVSGSRYLPESGVQGIEPPKDRIEINRRITAKINIQYNLGITDSFCGFKRYRVNAFRNHNFTENGYASPLELWSYIFHFSLRVKELNVDRIYITDDRSFGDDLDRKRKRYQYYLKVWKKMHLKYENMPKEPRNK
jgi:glycosyltransferase involved in cell wall biosynthesis